MPDEGPGASALGARWLPFGAVSGHQERPDEPATSGPQRGVDDEELVRRAQDGRREAFEELRRRPALLV